MILMIVERVQPSLRGEISRWLMEISAGVFLGRVSALVRDHLWDRACAKQGKGGVILVYSWPNEQGFAIRCSGTKSRDIIDADGLYLVRRRYETHRGVAPATIEKSDT